MPPPPETPPIILSADGSPVTVEGASFDPLLKPQDVGGAGGLGGEPQTGTGEDPGKASGSEGSCGALALLIAVLLFIVVYIIWCLVRLADNKKCGVEDYFDEFSEDPPDPRDPPNQMTQQGLDAMRKPESAAHLIKDIFDVQMRLWQAFEAARNALVVHGLIYPPPAALQQKLHRQFLIAFTAGPWPRSEVPAAEASFQSYPMTPAEQPPQPSPYPATREPDWLLRVGLADNESTFSEIALAAFRALQDGARPEDHANLDLDADRSRRHTCWTVAAGTSITDPALSVEILSFASE